MQRKYSVLELCAGGGGQALGYEMAGFDHIACVEYEPEFCKTLKDNRPAWNVVCQDIRNLDPTPYRECDLLAGGVPCPPFSIAGKQLGNQDERDLFPTALRIIEELRPRGVQLENVRGLMSDKFNDYRKDIVTKLEGMGYSVAYRVLESADFGVPQLRPRFILVALKPDDMAHFRWPVPHPNRVSVGEAIADLLAAKGWPGASSLSARATTIAPTLVGGSRKHGGPDLGPTRARRQWASIGIDGRGLANDSPPPDFPLDSMPRLTLRMAARIQGFPDTWKFHGGKTVQYRQIGNAFPPPVAKSIGTAIREAFEETDRI